MIASLKKLNTWILKHNPKWLALIRVAVGASLLLKGVDYLDKDHVQKLVSDFHIIMPSVNEAIVMAIPWIHIVGGFLIMLGLFTRFAAILQIPILAAGVFFVWDYGLKTEVFARPEQFYFSIIQIVFLCIFIIEGSGTLSLSRYFKEADGEVSEDDDEESES
jgi:putative oxidoreductase